MRKRLSRDGEVDYQVARSNDRWADHQARTLTTAALVSWLRPETVMDPACGDGSIVRVAATFRPIAQAFMADISKPNIDGLQLPFRHRALCVDIAAAIDEFPNSDVVVLTEVLEHLEDPDAILRGARGKGRFLIASSPEMRVGQEDTNPEHLWQFDRDGYNEMLIAAGWEVVEYTYLHFLTEYDFGIWVCR